MIAPTLLVGLGGTGSKIVCRVSQMVTEEQRKRIGFAVFDTDINELREIREANPFIKTIQTSTKLTVGEYLNIDTHARDEWFPVNGILNSKSLTEGAGQVRAISRLALDTAIRAGNMEPLHNAIEELYKLEGDSSEQALRVVIVSSLAGGTGSGLILPVALYLKNYLATKFQASANITRGFFILPEVFYEVIRGQSERNNLKCNASGKLDFEHSYLRRQINELASIEYGKDGLSIFDVALLLKVSTPSAEFDKTVGKGIMREILTLIYEYAQTMVLEADLDRIYGKFVLEQFEMFDKNIDWYMDNWKDNFSDYINDLMRIAVSDIERKKLTDIYEEMRKIMKESSKKRG